MKNFKNLLLVVIAFLQLNSYLFGQDVTPPTANLYAGTANIILPTIGYVPLPAVYFNHQSHDDVTPDDLLRFSYSADVNDNNKSFCAFGLNEIEIFVWDEANNYSISTARLNIDYEQDQYECCACFGDKTPPVAVCYQGKELEIQANGLTTLLFPNSLTYGSYDNETGIGNHTEYLNGMEFTRFGCDQLGENILGIIVCDWAGNKDTCSSLISINDPNDYCSALSKSKIDNSISISFQPNPANTEVVIQNADQFKFIQIMDTNGEVINRFDRLTPKFSINTTQIPNGVYYIQAGNHNKLTVSKKLVVAH